MFPNGHLTSPWLQLCSGFQPGCVGHSPGAALRTHMPWSFCIPCLEMLPRPKTTKVKASPSHGMNEHPKFWSWEKHFSTVRSTHIPSRHPSTNANSHHVSRHMPLTGLGAPGFWACNLHTLAQVLELLQGLSKEVRRRTNLWGLKGWKRLADRGDYMGFTKDGGIWVLTGLHQMGFCHSRVKHAQTVRSVNSSRDTQGRCPVRRDGEPHLSTNYWQMPGNGLWC